MEGRPFSEWVKLEGFTCPACPACPEKSKYDWVCRDDGDDVFINALGQMKCTTGAHNGDILAWSWICGNEFHNGIYFPADLDGFTVALSLAFLLQKKMGAEWVGHLIKNLVDQRQKYQIYKYGTHASGI